MSEQEPREEEAPDALEVRQMGQKIAQHTDAVVKEIGAVMLAEMAAEGKRWVQLSNAELQATTERSEWLVRDRLERMERERIVRRERRHGKPQAGARGPDRRGDFYAPAAVEDANHPMRAGPTKERPEGVTSSPEPQDGSASPVRDNEPEAQNHP